MMGILAPYSAAYRANEALVKVIVCAAFLIVSYGGTYLYGRHDGKASVVAEFQAKTAKAKAEIESEISAQETELKREFALREVLRDKVKENLQGRLIDYAKTAKSDVVVCDVVDDAGLQLISDAVKGRARASQPQGAETLPGASPAGGRR